MLQSRIVAKVRKQVPEEQQSQHRKAAASEACPKRDERKDCVPLAPLAEQEAIVEAVEDQLSVIEHIEADKLKSAQALRQSILRHAFTGQLVLQDPHDEPASELLKRLAADRDQRTRLLKTAKAAKQQPAASRGRKKSTP